MVMLPVFDEENNTMPYVDGDNTNYVYFGKVIPKGKSKPLNAIKTTYKWSDTDDYVYAIALETEGYSLTNMAYGNNNEIYLAKDGHCYQAKMNRI